MADVYLGGNFQSIGNDEVDSLNSGSTQRSGLYPWNVSRISNRMHNVTSSNGTSGEMMMNVQNTSNSVSVYQRDENLAKVEIGVLAAILFMAIFGNLTALIVLKFRKTKLTRMQWFIVHLCLADLFVAFFNVLPQLAWDITFTFKGNNFLCKFVKFTQLYAMYASSYVLIVCAIDRYISICYPLMSHTWSMRRAHLMVLIAWSISGLFSVPHLFMFSYEEFAPGQYNCLENLLKGGEWKMRLYVTWNFLSVYGIPLIILAFVYLRICYVVWVNVESRESSNRRDQKYSAVRVSFRKEGSPHGNSCTLTTNSRVHTKSASKSKIKTIKLTLVVVLCYLMCWAPFYFVQMWWAWDPTAPYTSESWAIILLLASLNSCTNPWIYLAFSGNVCLRKKRTLSRLGGTMNTSLESEARSRNSYSIQDTSLGNLNRLRPPSHNNLTEN